MGKIDTIQIFDSMAEDKIKRVDWTCCFKFSFQWKYLSVVRQDTGRFVFPFLNIYLSMNRMQNFIPIVIYFLYLFIRNWISQEYPLLQLEDNIIIFPQLFGYDIHFHCKYVRNIYIYNNLYYTKICDKLHKIKNVILFNFPRL